MRRGHFAALDTNSMMFPSTFYKRKENIYEAVSNQMLTKLFCHTRRELFGVMMTLLLLLIFTPLVGGSALNI